MSKVEVLKKNSELLDIQQNIFGLKKEIDQKTNREKQLDAPLEGVDHLTQVQIEQNNHRYEAMLSTQKGLLSLQNQVIKSNKDAIDIITPSLV